MLISIFYAMDCALRSMRAGQTALSAIHRHLTTGLLYCNGTFATGFLAGRKFGTDRLYCNALLFCASSYCFYGMMFCIDAMFMRTHESSIALGANRAAWQFVVTRNAVWLIWHLFPIVWACAACQSISPEVEHMGYIFSDMTAKFLLMFVYVASTDGQIIVQRGPAATTATHGADLPVVVGQQVPCDNEASDSSSHSPSHLRRR